MLLKEKTFKKKKQYFFVLFVNHKRKQKGHFNIKISKFCLLYLYNSKPRRTASIPVINAVKSAINI